MVRYTYIRILSKTVYGTLLINCSTVYSYISLAHLVTNVTLSKVIFINGEIEESKIFIVTHFQFSAVDTKIEIPEFLNDDSRLWRRRRPT